ncbi:hypothetical protein CFP71_27925 [Amycolatopsis thailandensis]|uniref:Uncharacterized protein n=1 Tax=Amycolatopsis thailandensis TaxID=589330 RepID=A0A229RUR0_9PSEU|nr:hypothetical protein [Amycolatopsis thailandensis]OXM50265.1 hypothetical protein CFP71_27925 [Amycolatopsis thailandensis]
MLPVLTDVVALVDYLAARATVLSDEELDLALGRVGRVDGPVLVSGLQVRSLITDTQLTAVLGRVWSMAEYPDRALGHARWRELFAKAGYAADGRPESRPDTTLRLYRGSVERRRTDWSWTDSLDVARDYALSGIRGRPRGTIWTALVDPAMLLARNTGRDEKEYIVDTSGLAIDSLNEDEIH